MKKVLYICTICFLLQIAIPANVYAISKIYGTITIYNWNKLEPLPNVEVKIEKLKRGQNWTKFPNPGKLKSTHEWLTYTDDKGKWSIFLLSPGRYKVTFKGNRVGGYRLLTVHSNKNKKIDMNFPPPTCDDCFDFNEIVPDIDSGSSTIIYYLTSDFMQRLP